MKDNAPGTRASPLRTLLLEHYMKAGMLPLGSHLSYWSARRKGRSSWMIHHSFFQRSGSPYGLLGDVDTFRKWSPPSSPHPREKETSWQRGRASCHGAVKHLWPAQTMPPSQTPKSLDPFRVWSTQYLWEDWTLLPVFNLTASRAAAQCWHNGSNLVSPHSAPLHPRSRSADPGVSPAQHTMGQVPTSLCWRNERVMEPRGRQGNTNVPVKELCFWGPCFSSGLQCKINTPWGEIHLSILVWKTPSPPRSLPSLLVSTPLASIPCFFLCHWYFLASSSSMAPISPASLPVQYLHSKVRPGKIDLKLQPSSALGGSQRRVHGQHTLGSGDPSSPPSISSHSLCGHKKITIMPDQTAVWVTSKSVAFTHKMCL